MSTSPRKVTDQSVLAACIRDHGPHCLIIARHGETAWNVAGRLQGQQDIPLSRRGRNQASAAAQLLMAIPLDQVHSSTLGRCQETARAIAKANISQPHVLTSDLLKETSLGVLEGELKDEQSTTELTNLYRNFSRDEIRYRVPGGENLHDVAARVASFFGERSDLLDCKGIHIVVGHRNVNKMILKHVLGLSFEEGRRVEHEHQRLYLYFGVSKVLWSCWLEDTTAQLAQGYATTMDSGYA